MSPGTAATPPPAPAGWLLRLGARAAVSALAPLLALAGVLAVTRVVQRMLWPALFLSDPALQLEQTLLVGGTGLLLAAALGRAVVLAIGVRAGAARLRTAPELGGVPPATAGLRGIAWAAAAAVVDTLLSAWFWSVLVSSAVALLLGGPVVSLLGAVGLALALSLGAFLGAAAALWLELGLVVSVVRPMSMGAAAAEALRILLARPGFLVLAWLVTALPAGLLAGGAQVLAAAAPGPSVGAAGAVGIAVLLVALIEALATLIRLDAMAALVLDREGALPLPPVPVPRATLVGPGAVDARPVGPMSPWNPGAPR
ncbi:MAG TPA: hypothetical protein VMT11_18620 [Myxococcaceae bacterium]|nr:hypothetical protein [Myxococcaceae bacterium]